ncbi:MAG: cellulase family glycosylhydrolase [Paludibacteraceae bacterium]
MKNSLRLLLLVFSALGGIFPTLAQPAITAPTPIHNATDVISLFSDHYTTTGNGPQPQGWGGSNGTGNVVRTTISNTTDEILRSANNSHAIYTTGWTAQKKGYIHLDVYSVSGGIFSFSLGVSFSNIVTTLPDYDWPELKAGAWTKIDVPFVKFVENGLDDAVNIQMIRFYGTGTYYVDNVYAYGDKSVFVETVDIPAAPIPTHDVAVVKSVFSDSYTPSSKGVTPQAFGGTVAKLMPYETAREDSLLRLINLGSSLCNIATWKISDMDYIHIDVYNNGNGDGAVPFSFGLTNVWDQHNIETISDYTWPVTLPNQWVGMDIPVSKFKETALNLDGITQMMFYGSGDYYIDNIYAYSGKLEDVLPPVAVPEIILNEGNNVKSIFCEQFETAGYQDSDLGMTDLDANGNLMDYGQNESQSREFVEIVQDNRTIKLNSWNDYPFKIHKNSTTMDMSDMDYLHCSVYLMSPLDPDGKQATITFWMHDNAGNKITANIPTIAMSSGQWVSFSIPLCYFKDAVDLSNVYVLRLRVSGYAGMEAYVDNIFAYKGDAISNIIAPDCGYEQPCTEPIADSSTGQLPPRDRAYLGVNLASASGGTIPGTFGTNYAMPKFEDLWYFKAKGVRLVRLPFRWKRVQSSVNGALTEKDITEMKKVVAEAERLGIWVMLDMHDYCERTENDRFYEIGVAGHKEKNGDGSWGNWITDETPGITAEHFADVWKKLANEFKDFTNIWGYDLMNEPKGIDINILKNNYQTAINAIREVDTNTPIVVEGKNYANSQNWATVSGALKDLTDPSGIDVVYQAHVYFDNDNSGTYNHAYNESNSQIYKTRIDPFVKWLKDNNKKGMIGEFGVPYNGADNSDERYMGFIDNVFQYLKENQLTSTYWCGGYFYETYALSVSPNKDYCTEKSTMQIMENYTWDFHKMESAISEPPLSDKAKVLVYPNPVANALVIEAKENISSICVFNLFGQSVFEEKISESSKRTTINFSKHCSGSYMLQIEFQDGTSSAHKIVKM